MSQNKLNSQLVYTLNDNPIGHRNLPIPFSCVLHAAVMIVCTVPSLHMAFLKRSCPLCHQPSVRAHPNLDFTSCPAIHPPLSLRVPAGHLSSCLHPIDSPTTPDALCSWTVAVDLHGASTSPQLATWVVAQTEWSSILPQSSLLSILDDSGHHGCVPGSRVYARCRQDLRGSMAFCRRRSIGSR